MTTSPPPPARTPGDPAAWDAFWRGGEAAALTPDPCAGEEALAVVWASWFAAAERRPGPVRVLDAAGGAGAVAARARAAFAGSDPGRLTLVSLDIAPAAARAARAADPRAQAVVGDAAAPPFADGAFTLAASQFGIEYAGAGAFPACGSLVAPSGGFGAVCHRSGGAIDAECRRNAAAADAVLAADVLEATRAAFASAAQIRTGAADRAALTPHHAAVSKGARALEAIVAEYGTGAAGGLATRIYKDLRRLFGAMDAYAAEDVAVWCGETAEEVAAYRTRMAAMSDAALDAEAFAAARRALEGVGLVFDPARTGPLDAGAEAIAWTLFAKRPAA